MYIESFLINCILYYYIIYIKDIAEISIQQAKERYNNLRYKYPANIYAADCFTVNFIYNYFLKIKN